MDRRSRGNQDRKYLRIQVVAQFFADVTFWSSTSGTRWSFHEANVPVVVSLIVPLVTPLDELQMKPPLTKAALIT